MTKLSKLYFGLSRDSVRLVASPAAVTSGPTASGPVVSNGAVSTGWRVGSCISGFTTIAKLTTSGASAEMAPSNGTRMRCSSIPRVSSFGTSR